MTNNDDTHINTFTLYKLILAFIFITLSACAAAPDKQSNDSPMVESETANVSDENVSMDNQAGASLPVEPGKEEVASVEHTVEVKEEKQTKELAIVESCKDQPYVKYEKQALASIDKGLAATKAEKFGVGFRDLGEYNRWHDIHQKIFTEVNRTCGTLEQCVKDNPKDKATKCADEVFVYNEWQNMAERFTNKAKAVETTQPEMICSFEPNLEDAPNCFHGLSDNIDKVCTTTKCKEASDCWRGIGFLDQAIKQAAQACAFVHKEISDCRGYVEAKKRRENNFKRCMDMQEQLNIPLFPAI